MLISPQTPLIVLPTALGNRGVAIPSRFNMKKRLLCRTPRELLLQRGISLDPSNLNKAEIEQAGTHAAADAKCDSSVPTTRMPPLYRDFSRQFHVLDEAHHAVAPSYRRISSLRTVRIRASRYLIGFPPRRAK